MSRLLGRALCWWLARLAHGSELLQIGEVFVKGSTHPHGYYNSPYPLHNLLQKSPNMVLLISAPPLQNRHMAKAIKGEKVI